MIKNRFSKNRKTDGLMRDIEQHILYNFDYNFDDAVKELKRYKDEFWNVVDYNYAQYGNLLVYYKDVRKFYEESGYNLRTVNDTFLWKRYLMDVRRVINVMLSNDLKTEIK